MYGQYSMIKYMQGEGNGTPLQYSCLENPMDGGAWWAAVHGVAKSQIWLSDFTFPFHFHTLEKEMATHSSVLAWRIPGTGEPGGLPSMGSHRVGHDWSDLAAAAAGMTVHHCTVLNDYTHTNTYTHTLYITKQKQTHWIFGGEKRLNLIFFPDVSESVTNGKFTLLGLLLSNIFIRALVLSGSNQIKHSRSFLPGLFAL